MDPIERYGVSLNDARLKAEALSLGLYSGTGDLTANAKASAALAAITKQTSAAHGQFARELDTVAGKQAVASAQAENAAASLGDVLAPAAKVLTDVLAKLAVEVKDAIAGKDLSEPVTKFSRAVKGLGTDTPRSTVAVLNAFADLRYEVADGVSTLEGANRTIGKVTFGLLGTEGAADTNKDVWRAFNQVLADSPSAAVTAADALRQLQQAADSGNTNAQERISNWGLTSEQIDIMQLRARDAAGEFKKFNEEQVKGDAAARMMANALEKEEDAARAAKDSTRNLRNAIKDLNDLELASQEGHRRRDPVLRTGQRAERLQRKGQGGQDASRGTGR
jgi:hypothetical protein